MEHKPEKNPHIAVSQLLYANPKQNKIERPTKMPIIANVILSRMYGADAMLVKDCLCMSQRNPQSAKIGQCTHLADISRT